jgi:hypothetical protein
MLQHLKISAPTIGEPPTIELNGQPMGDKVRAVTLHMEAGSTPTAKLEYFARPVGFEGMVEMVSGDTNDAERWRQLAKLCEIGAAVTLDRSAGSREYYVHVGGSMYHAESLEQALVAAVKGEAV